MDKRPISCPKCSYKMEELKFAGIDLDSCPFCSGCWLDAQEIEKMTRSRGNNKLQVTLNKPQKSDLNCPRCRPTHAMQVGPHVDIPSLVLDQCTHCGGVWLDRGELTTLLSHKK